jgi:hypothetical protein
VISDERITLGLKVLARLAEALRQQARPLGGTNRRDGAQIEIFPIERLGIDGCGCGVALIAWERIESIERGARGCPPELR